ncbi:reticulocyte-binding protein 2 a [Cladorrhinum samala]|uniref:DASH complex subunit SPC34 n=1 Tax=Cladorrhinum samala TaxID=585594 RepID=A0AAV9HP56_9PEZI|nr:reticulocyte-binding protein 2 a [Cladorrhinum samala]
MSLLLAHLEQISLSCQGIDSLPFPPPKIFTNALLSKPDITSLIRDTEAHERALFSVPPPPPPPTNPNPESSASSSRRKTVFNVTAGEVTTGGPAGGVATRRNTAVAAVLGGNLHSQITRQKPGGDVDIEILLQGAEKLCGVYALPGALDRIPGMRRKWEMQKGTLMYYEQKVAEQVEQLERMNAERRERGQEEEDEKMEEVQSGGKYATEEDLRAEEEAVRVLDRKKRELQARLKAVEQDLGGLMEF